MEIKNLFFLILLILIFLVPVYVKAEIVFSGAEIVSNFSLENISEEFLDSSDASSIFNFALISQSEIISNFDLIQLSEEELYSNDSLYFIEFALVNQSEIFSNFNLSSPFQVVPIITFFPKNPIKSVEVKFDASASFSLFGKIEKFNGRLKIDQLPKLYFYQKAKK